MSDLITPEQVPNAGAPTTPSEPFEPVVIETEAPVVDDGLPFTPEVFGGQ